ncbi:MAG: 4Fe-4S binding protein [Spirochaetes bacterium]|nr:4Fe-4S binding protein [Spirochaetota bacterium]
MNNNVILVSNNSPHLYDKFQKLLTEKNLINKYQLKKFNTFGLNTYTSIIKIYPDKIIYVDSLENDIEEIVNDHLINGKIVKRLLYKNEHKNYLKSGPLPIYHKQLRLVLRNSGLIDPESIESYLSREGYRALAKILNNTTQDNVIDEIKISELRGRGGAGYPTWLKWNFTKQAQSDIKYIICNADEGDPGAYMDRSVLEGDPHSVIEGMIIAAFTVNANNGFIYIRAEYPLAIKRLEKAIKDAKEYGFLGKNILGTNFSFDIEIRLGAGAFVCGEETALISSIEGNRGMPRPRPPFPSTKGLWEKPTVINNVETLANIPLIILKGGDWYNKIGTEKSKGTKVFALTGKVKNSGLVEVPMGTSLREIIYDVGGGILNDNKFKAVQTGGPSGGVIPEDKLDTPISYESLNELGSIMGSGGMIVMDHTDCMVDVSKFYLQFSVDESCGKCSPCRIGGRQMLDLLTNISEGKSDESIIEKIEAISSAMQKASLCGLGQTAPNPVISTLKYFKDEYIDHIVNKKCISGKCKSLIVFEIDKNNCIGCHLCAIKCPVNAISGGKKEIHYIDQNKCIKCGLCFDACKFNAVIKS